MASSKQEETEFYRRLRKKIVEIPELSRWVEPEHVVIVETLEDAPILDDIELILSDAHTREEPRNYGISGDYHFACYITALIARGETASGNEPENVLGELDAESPSLAVIDGILRDAFDLETLDGYAWTTELGEGAPVSIIEPEGAVGRQWIFTGTKEVSR